MFCSNKKIHEEKYKLAEVGDLVDLIVSCRL